jgi:hypothetical protein
LMRFCNALKRLSLRLLWDYREVPRPGYNRGLGAGDARALGALIRWGSARLEGSHNYR